MLAGFFLRFLPHRQLGGFNLRELVTPIFTIRRCAKAFCEEYKIHYTMF